MLVDRLGEILATMRSDNEDLVLESVVRVRKMLSQEGEYISPLFFFVVVWFLSRRGGGVGGRECLSVWRVVRHPLICLMLSEPSNRGSVWLSWNVGLPDGSCCNVRVHQMSWFGIFTHPHAPPVIVDP